jgi:hypothetical protein
MDSSLSESDAEADLVRQLRAIAGVGEQAREFEIARDGFKVRVEYNGGSSSSLSLSAPYGLGEPPSSATREGYREGAMRSAIEAARPMKILLRRENSRDVTAKQKGVAREHQTGDAPFDEQVYIDTRAEDATLSYVLSAPQLRQGALLLLREGFQHIELDDEQGRVRCVLFIFANKRHDEARAGRILAAFEQVVRRAPRVRRKDVVAAKRRVDWLDVVATIDFILLVACIPLASVMAPSRCSVASSDGEGSSFTCAPSGCCEPLWQGFLLGALLATIVPFVVTRFIRGKSDSHKQRLYVFALLGWLIFASTMLLFLYVRWRA